MGEVRSVRPDRRRFGAQVAANHAEVVSVRVADMAAAAHLAVVQRARLATLTLTVGDRAASHSAMGVAESGRRRRDGGIETLVGHDAVHTEVVVVGRARAPVVDVAAVVARDRNSLGSRLFSVLRERRRSGRRRR